MKRTLIIYPIFFVVNYFLLKNIEVWSMFSLSLLLLVFVSAISLSVYYFTKDVYRSAFITFLFLVWSLYYGAFTQIFQDTTGVVFNLAYHVIFFITYTIAIIFAGSHWIWKRLSPRMLTQFLNLVTAATFIIGGYLLLRAETHAYLEPMDWKDVDIESQSIEWDGKPDIYYIILDGYGRADVLNDLYGYDNSDFIDFLTSRGFYVADQSQSNYFHTALSLSSSLNMSYIQPLPGSQIRTPIIRRLISDNRARSILKSQGYQFTAFNSAVYYSTISDADVFFSLTEDRTNVSFLGSMLLPGSLGSLLLAADLASPGGETYRDQQARVWFTFEQLGQLSASSDPRFVFAHILVPHPPYVFDRNGPVTPEKQYYLQRFEEQEESKQAYIQQLEYVNTLVKETIDAILKNADTAPVIILQSDHGPGAHFSGDIEKCCLYEKSSILNAYYFPGEVYNSLNESITPVNSFRVVFNQFFGLDLDLLEDRTFYSTGDAAFSFVDVTEESAIPCQLP